MWSDQLDNVEKMLKEDLRKATREEREEMMRELYSRVEALQAYVDGLDDGGVR